MVMLELLNSRLIPFSFLCLNLTRKVGDNAYKPTTWQIKFKLERIDQSGSYTLRIALSSATFSILEVIYHEISSFFPFVFF